MKFIQNSQASFSRNKIFKSSFLTAHCYSLFSLTGSSWSKEQNWKGLMTLHLRSLNTVMSTWSTCVEFITEHQQKVGKCLYMYSVWKNYKHLDVNDTNAEQLTVTNVKKMEKKKNPLGYFKNLRSLWKSYSRRKSFLLGTDRDVYQE